MNRRLTIACWNLYQGRHHSSDRNEWLPNEDLESHLAAFDADVLVLPEAWKFRDLKATWSQHLAEALGYELHEFIGDMPSRPRDVCPWRMVVLTRIPATRLEDHAMERLGSFGQRAFVRLELTDHAVTLAAGHLYGIHALKRNPRLWLRERADFREVTANHDIVVGDMNIWGPFVRRDASDLRQAVKGATWRADRPHSQIDHLLVSNKIQVVTSGVSPDLGSDHRAIHAELQIDL